MRAILLCILLASLFICACDNRVPEKPIVSVITSPETVYNVANHDTVSIICQMAGDETSIANQTIHVYYDPALGLLIGDGASNTLYTNDNGYASGLFKVHTGYYGDIEMTFSPNHYPEQAKTITLRVQDMPRITTFYPADSTLVLGEAAYTDITLQITGHSLNIENRTIHFSSTPGTSLEYSVAQTDSAGHVTNVFHRNSFSGEAVIGAYIDIYPEDIHTITVNCE